MITQQELESLGFVPCEPEKPFYIDRPSVRDGSIANFYKYIDNGHVWEGHDTTEIRVFRYVNCVIIEIESNSSHFSRKEIVFKGRCETFEFFNEVLNSVLEFYRP